jgi:hypothetical protein
MCQLYIRGYDNFFSKLLSFFYVMCINMIVVLYIRYYNKKRYIFILAHSDVYCWHILYKIFYVQHNNRGFLFFVFDIRGLIVYIIYLTGLIEIKTCFYGRTMREIQKKKYSCFCNMGDMLSEDR